MNLIIKKHFMNITIFNTVYKVIGVFISLGIAYSISKALENIGGQGTLSIFYISIFLLISLIQYILQFYFSIYIEKRKLRRIQEFKEFLYINILEGAEVRDCSKKEADFLVVIQKDVSQVISYYIEEIPSILQAIIGLTLYVVYFVFFIKSAMALLGILIIGLLQFIPPFVVRKYLVKNYIAAGESEAKLTQHIISGIKGFFTIKTFNIHEWFMKKFSYEQKKFEKIGMIASATSAVQSSMYSMVSFIQQFGLAFLIGLFLLMKSITFDAAIQIMALSNNIYTYIGRCFSIQVSRLMKKEAMNRIEKYIPISLQEKEEKEEKEILVKQNILSINELTFIQKDRVLFNNVSFKIKGEGIWVVKGKNGTGKSTFFQILSGGLNINKGTISINNKKISRKDISKYFAYCPQNPLLMEMSGEKLIELLPYSDERIFENLNYFGVKDDLLIKPLNALSGGERKKIMLSICLAKEAPILLLDEPETSLDKESLKRFENILKKRRQLMLIISHNNYYDNNLKGKICFNNSDIEIVENIAYK